jgi:hypothetical protein
MNCGEITTGWSIVRLSVKTGFPAGSASIHCFEQERIKRTFATILKLDNAPTNRLISKTWRDLARKRLDFRRSTIATASRKIEMHWFGQIKIALSNDLAEELKKASS